MAGSSLRTPITPCTPRVVRLTELAPVQDAKGRCGIASDIPFVPLRRAFLMTDAGRSREALAQIAIVLETAESSQVGAGLSRSLRRQALVARIAAETQMKDLAAATRTSAELDAAAGAGAGSPLAQSAMHYGRGMLALAQGDAGALAHF